MQVKLNHPPAAEEVKQAICTWLDMLAAEDYASAYNFTAHDPYYQWTPELMENVIKGYGFPYEETDPQTYKVTDWRTAVSDNDRTPDKDIDFFDEPEEHEISPAKVIGWVHYDLPLNGEWSDVTAIFKILQLGENVTLELNDIHVL